MIITCEQCQARFRLADEKLKSGGTKVRCSKCKHVFLVMPPEEPAAEEPVDFGSFNMERIGETESAPEPPAPPASEPPSAAGGGDMDLDFSGLEQTMGPGSGGELEEEFSFADAGTPAAPTDDAEPAGFVAATAEPAFSAAGEAPGELDFDTTFAESDTPAPAGTAAPESTEFTFAEEPAASAATPAPVEGSAEFDFAAEPPTGGEEFALDGEQEAASGEGFSFEGEAPAGIGEEFSFDNGQSAAAESSFDQAQESSDNAFTFGEETTSEDAGAFSFGQEETSSSSPFDADTAFGEEETTSWDKPAADDGPSFDFDEPSFETQMEEKPPKRGEDAGLGFGEIDFSSQGEGKSAPPSFGAEPDFAQATLARPAEPEAPPPPPPPRPAASRASREELMPAPAPPRKNPMSRMMLMLALLLVALCGAAAYFYFVGNGRQMVDNLLLKVKGEEPAAPLEQRIGLNIEGSSYVDNREAGQLLVIQGTATNNFTGSRSAITVKGLILDAGGKILQQQTVFCGNHLSGEKLRTMKYTQVEEAMNNQFGDSLVNMNVKPGVSLPFTIVFRNVSKEMANINVEVVDSKPGGPE